jgi:hypothetical protein
MGYSREFLIFDAQFSHFFHVLLAKMQAVSTDYTFQLNFDNSISKWQIYLFIYYFLMVFPFPSNYLLALDWPEIIFFFSKIIAEYWPSLNQIIIEALDFICSFFFNYPDFIPGMKFISVNYNLFNFFYNFIIYHSVI